MARKTIERNISFDDARGLYYVNMDLSRDETGKRVKQYRTYPTLPAARAGLRDFLSRREQEMHSPRHQMTLSQWLEYWMDTIIRPNRAETTVYAYQKIIDNHLGPALGDRLLVKLTPRDIQQYYIQVQRDTGLSSNTMRRHHDLLSSSFRTAVRQDMLAYSPMDRVEPPRSKLYEADFYNPEELKRLYALLSGHWLELPVKLAGSLGLRREELCGLKWENVSFQRRVIYIREARTAFGATIVQKETKKPLLGAHPLHARGHCPPAGRRAGSPALGGAPGRGPRGAGPQGAALLPQRPVPGLHPVRAEKQPAPGDPPRPAPLLRHHRLLPGGLPL